MSAFTPGSSVNTPAQLANHLFQVPQAGLPQPPVQPPVTLSGGVVPGAQPPVNPLAAPSGFPQPPAGPQVPPPIQYPSQTAPVQYQPQYPPQPVAPAAAPVQPAAPAVGPNRIMLDKLVSSGDLTPEEAAYYPSDDHLFRDLLTEAAKAQRPQTPPANQQPPAPQQPVQPQVQQQSLDEINRMAVSLQQSGALLFEGNQYKAKYPEFQAVADRLNSERMRAEQHLLEFSDPQAWLKKYGQTVIEEQVKPLQEQILTLRQQLAEALPKPHDTWIDKHRPVLYEKDAAGNLTQNLSPVGQVYDRMWNQMADMGIKDTRALHAIAASAAENAMQLVPAVPQAPPAQPQQSFWQASATQQAPLIPGFNSPGTPLARHQAQQAAIPVTNQGYADFHGIAAGILNGSIPRT